MTGDTLLKNTQIFYLLHNICLCFNTPFLILLDFRNTVTRTENEIGHYE